MIFNEQPKSQPISRLQVNEAFKRVKANKGSSGVDGITIEEVAKKSTQASVSNMEQNGKWKLPTQSSPTSTDS